VIQGINMCVNHCAGPATAADRAEHVAVAGERQRVQPVAEQIREEQAEPERMDRDPDQDDHGRGPVEERPRPEGGENAEWERNQEPENRAADRQGKRDGQRVTDDLRHGATRDVGAAERAVGDSAHPLPVLDDDRARELLRSAWCRGGRA
jgi:hypothetical protein